jgi:hypothetical protein
MCLSVLITGYLTGETRQAALVKQKQLTFPENLSSLTALVEFVLLNL